VAGLGIRHVGGQMAQELAEKFGSIENIMNATLKELKKALTIEKERKIPKIIFDFINNEENKKLIRKTKEENKNLPLWQLIKKLRIPKVGLKRAKELAKKFNTIDKLINAKLEEIIKTFSIIPDPVIPKSIYDYFHNKRNLDVIKEMLILKVKPETIKTKTSGELAGMSIVITGTLKHFSRQQIEQLIKDLGGKTSSSVSKRTTFLVAGEDPGLKLQEAKKLGIDVIDENKFIRLIQHKPKLAKKSNYEQGQLF